MTRTFGSTDGTIEIDGEQRCVEILYATEHRPATRTSPAESSLVVEEAQFVDGDSGQPYAMDEALFDRHYDRLFRIADNHARRPLIPF